MARAKQIVRVESQLDLNPLQQQAVAKAFTNTVKYLLLAGGSRSGKSFVLAYIILLRAMMAPGSRHFVCRKTAASCRTTLFDLTFRDVMRKAYPGLIDQCVISESEMTITLPQKSADGTPSVILFGGLDDSARLEKVLGNEFASIWCNEVSELTYNVISTLITRLNQDIPLIGPDAATLKPKLFCDLNPKTKQGWEYRMFVRKIRADQNLPINKPDEWDWLRINPQDNLGNLNADYLESLENLSAEQRKRFLEGEWSDDNSGALFQEKWIEENRHPFDKPLPDMDRIVVAVDPAVSSNKDSDEHGIIVAGVAKDIAGVDHIYILDDYTTKGSPTQWASRAVDAYITHKADRIVAEKNQGGDMVAHTLYSVAPTVPVTMVHATRGKLVRAEPVSALYERGLVHHAKHFKQLEEQMIEYDGKGKSPDRMDAMVWAVTELAPLEAQQNKTMTIHSGSGLYW